MLKVTHMGVSICLLQEAETFSILSIWAGERRAAGHAPRGIHLTFHWEACSQQLPRVTGEMSGTFLSSFVTLSNKEALYIMAGMLSFFFFFFILQTPFTAEKMTSIRSVWEVSQKINILVHHFAGVAPLALWCCCFPVWFGWKQMLIQLIAPSNLRCGFRDQWGLQYLQRLVPRLVCMQTHCFKH